LSTAGDKPLSGTTGGTADVHLRYSFRPVERCNMCGAPAAEHRVLGKRLNRSQGMFPRKRKGLTVTVVKCGRCQLIYADPQPVPFDLQDHYGVPPASYWKEEYFTVSPDYFAGEIARFKQLVPFTRGMRALDIGAGLGKAMISLQRAGFDTYGFEPSGPFREQAIARMGIDPQRLRLGDMETITYEPGQFDLITFGAVLEHLYDPDASIRKAMGWLRPGGHIHIEVPSSAWLVNRIINLAYRLQGLDYVGNISPMHMPFHLYEFGLKSFEENGRRSGYTVAFHEYFVAPTYMPKLIDPLLTWWMRRTDTGMQLSLWLRKS
jgi:2-polyprenyl-3-methyl-5-hydroxy-6-metoxy-1,4-benzoquinol methylase